MCRAAGRALSGPGRGPRRPPVRRCRAAVRGTRRTPGGGGARGRLPRGVPVPPRSPSGYAADPGPVIVCPLLRFCAPRVRRVRAPCAHVLCGSRGAVGLVPAVFGTPSVRGCTAERRRRFCGTATAVHIWPNDIGRVCGAGWARRGYMPPGARRFPAVRERRAARSRRRMRRGPRPLVRRPRATLMAPWPQRQRLPRQQRRRLRRRRASGPGVPRGGARARAVGQTLE